jgi:acyl carrier protein
MNQDGTRVLVTVPISIGARSVVGGGAMIHPGVVIGVDAVVEPCSNVSAMTQIGDGEVWGGNPARFLRMRNEVRSLETDNRSAPHSPLSETDELLLRTIVAKSLNRPVDSITPDFSRRESAAWDSLAQLRISLSLQQEFGIQLSSQESFQLSAMSDLRAVLRQSRSS